MKPADYAEHVRRVAAAAPPLTEARGRRIWHALARPAKGVTQQ